MTRTADEPIHVEQAVLERYRAGAREVQPALCCPTSYESKYLDLLPQEICEKDYGCGDPSRYVNSGDTVVDLGSGAGKICYILAQKVGAGGRVIGVDFNDEMLTLARKYRREMAEKLGFSNVEFIKGKIQDLALPLDAAEQWLSKRSVSNFQELSAFEAECDRLRTQQTLIADGSVDVVVSNCVLNLVRSQDKKQLFDELLRVLRRGGRAVISDIVCDEDPTPPIRNDPDLWSGCIAGAFREDVFLNMFEEAGFYGVEILARQESPWQVINGIEFRSITVRAFKGKDGPCHDRKQAVVYTGPWKRVVDDDGHTLHRGERMAVCDKTYNIYCDPEGPYHTNMIPIAPHDTVPLDEAPPFTCVGGSRRHPKQTKGGDYKKTAVGTDSPCCPEGDCC